MSNRTARRYADQARQFEIERDEARREVERAWDTIRDAEALLKERAAEIERLTAALSEVTKERDEARANNERTMCSYCGHIAETGGKTLDQVTDEMVAHITTCPAHPFAKAEASIKVLAEANVDQLCALRLALPGFIELHAQQIGCPACPPAEEDSEYARAGRCPAVAEIEAAIAKGEALLPPAAPEPAPDAHLEAAHEERESAE